MARITEKEAALLEKIIALWGKLSREEAAAYFTGPERFYRALQREYTIDQKHADAALHDLAAHAEVA